MGGTEGKKNLIKINGEVLQQEMRHYTSNERT